MFQMSEEAAAEDEEGEDNVPSYREWELPSAAFDTVRANYRIWDLVLWLGTNSPLWRVGAAQRRLPHGACK